MKELAFVAAAALYSAFHIGILCYCYSSSSYSSKETP